MAEQDNAIRPGVSGVEDTRTRKTVRLTPTVPETIVPIEPAASGLDNTSTGNVEMFNDTRTRRTVKLKPIAPGSPVPITAPGSSAARPDSSTLKLEAPAGDDTGTRKSTIIRPVATPPPSISGATPAPAAPAGDDTGTRKSTVLRPTATPPPSISGATPAPAAPAGDDTSTRKSTIVPPAAAQTPSVTGAAPAPDAASGDGESRTVRIQRPQRPAGSAPAPAMKLPGIGAKPAAPAPAPAAPAKPAAPAPAPAAPVKPAAPVPAPAPAAPEAIGVKKPAATSAPAASGAGKDAPKGDKKDVTVLARSGSAPSKFYMVLALLTLFAVLGASVITTLHYLKFEHQLDYSHLIPGLPVAK